MSRIENLPAQQLPQAEEVNEGVIATARKNDFGKQITAYKTVRQTQEQAKKAEKVDYDSRLLNALRNTAEGTSDVFEQGKPHWGKSSWKSWGKKNK